MTTDKIRLFTLPNLLTSMNLFCGCLACVQAHEHNYSYALLLIILSSVFDFFDGLVARALKQHSKIGLELDSLADDVSFGLAPSMIVFSLFREMDYDGIASYAVDVMPYLAFVMAVFSALRLAKFNIDTRQTSSFIGLPTPANALFWASVAAGLHDYILSINPFILLAAVAFFSFLLVCELPMFSFKFKSLGFGENKVRYVFVILSLLIICVTGMAGLAISICLYIIISLVIYIKQRMHDAV